MARVFELSAQAPIPSKRGRYARRSSSAHSGNDELTADRLADALARIEILEEYATRMLKICGDLRKRPKII